MNACATALLAPLSAPRLVLCLRPAALPARPLPLPRTTRPRPTVAPERRAAAARVPAGCSQELCRRALAEVNRSTHPGLQACFAGLGLAGVAAVGAAATGWWHLMTDDGLRAAVAAFLN